MRRLFCQALSALATLAFATTALSNPPSQPSEPPTALPWADITGDGVPEEIRLRAVVRNGVSGFDFGVWNPVGDQYYGDIVRAPEVPNMAGYNFAVGPDLDGDGLPELWVADPAAREFVNGRGCVYVYSWQHDAPVMRLRGPATDTLGTDLRIEVTTVTPGFRIKVASQFQDIFGHVYERWNEFSGTGTLLTTDDPASAVLVLRSGDVDKSLSTDPTDVAKVYAKAAELMAELGITGQKHDEDLDGDDTVDSVDIFKVLQAVGVPEPSVASLTEAAIYSIAPQRGMSSCGRCPVVTPCCLAGNCYCVTYTIPPDEKPRGAGSLPGWWRPQANPPGGGSRPVLPPGAYPDRRPTRDPAVLREECDGFRILPGDIEPGGIMVPATMRTGDTVTARIEDPTVAQFSADLQGKPLPKLPGGDIQLRTTLSDAQVRKAMGHIKVYGISAGETVIIVEITTRNANNVMETVEIRQYVKVGGRIEAQVQRVRRWKAPPSWLQAQRTAYENAVAADQAVPREYTPSDTPHIPSAEPLLGAVGGRVGLNPERLAAASPSEGDGADRVLLWDACDEPLTGKATRFFSKRTFIGQDGDLDGICDPQETLESQTLNSWNIEWAIANGKGPFANKRICQPDYRAETNPGSEIVAVIVGHAAERISFDMARSPGGHAGSHVRNYYYPQIFGALEGITQPQFSGGPPEFNRWTDADVGTSRYKPDYHRFTGQDVRFGRPFASGHVPYDENAPGNQSIQRQFITGATFIVPIMNAGVYEALEQNYAKNVSLGVIQLHEPGVPQGIATPIGFREWSPFGAPDFSSMQQQWERQQARSWMSIVNGGTVAQSYYGLAEVPPPTFVVPMTEQEFQELISQQVDPTEVWTKRGIFWAETATGFLPCADVFWLLYHAGMQVTGIDGEDHKLDMLMSVVGLAADLGYAGAAAGFVSNGAVAAARIAVKFIGLIDEGRTLRLILSQGGNALASIKRLIEYAMKHGDPYIEGIIGRLMNNPNSVPPAELAAAIATFARKQSDTIVNTYRRMQQSNAVQVMGAMVDATGAPLLIRNYEQAVLIVNQAVLDRVKRIALKPRGAEGWYILARLNNAPDTGGVAAALRGALDAGGDRASQELADAALQNVGEACAKTADGLSLRHARAVKDAAENAVRAYDSHLRGLVIGHIGLNPDGTKRAFATMAEFEALRVLPVENLNDVQRFAMRDIRLGMVAIGHGTPVVKVMGLQAAMARLTSGDATFSGFFARQADLSGANTSEQIINRLRVEHNGSPFTEAGGYVRMETVANPDIVAKSGVPLHPSIAGSPPQAGVHLCDDGLPCTRNGFAASVDGHLTPENMIRGSNPATCSPDVTVMHFKNADGSPMVITIGEYASDRWVLRQNDPANPLLGYRWEALP